MTGDKKELTLEQTNIERIAVVGTNQDGEELIRRTSSAPDNSYFEIVCFCDSTGQYTYETLHGFPNISLELLAKQYINGSIDKIIVAFSGYAHNPATSTVFKQLQDAGINDKVFIVPPWFFDGAYDYVHYTLQSITGDKKPTLRSALVKADMSKAVLDYVSPFTNLHCNFKCKACSVASPLAEPDFVSVSSFKNDFEKLKKLYWHISRIRITGGESLLHPDIAEIVQIIRDTYPATGLAIQTNGLLLLKDDGRFNELFKVMRETRCGFQISTYKPITDKKETLAKMLNKHGVEWHWAQMSGKPLEVFECFRMLKPDNDMTLQHKACYQTKYCHALRNGYLYPCGSTISSETIEKYFNVKFEKMDENIEKMRINLQDTKLDGWDIANFLKNPTPSCMYCCFERRRELKWEQFSTDTATLEDFVLTEGTNMIESTQHPQPKLLMLIDKKAKTNSIELDDEVKSELSKVPLLTGVDISSVVYLSDIIKPVLYDDLQLAIDEIFKLAEDNIPDESAESYLLLARNLCAACEYADGWVMFQKETIRFLAGDGRAADATVLLKELEELLPEDEELAELRSIVAKALNCRRSEVVTEIRSREEVDTGFKILMDLIAPLSEQQLYKVIQQEFNELRQTEKTIYENYFTTYPFWGELNIEREVYDALRNRAQVIHKYYKDFLWLYDRLADARSKNVLFGILSNWICFDFGTIEKYEDRDLPEYYHPEIFPVRDNEVFVDVGAYTGDSVVNFIMAYGLTYKQIYCYEILDEVFERMKENLKDVPNLELRRKAVGAESGVLYIDQGTHNSSSQLTNSGENAVEVVRLDDDIEESVTFIKMDIEGAEQDALRGCKRHMRENHPHLAISTYHGHEDIIAIPLYIDKVAPGYKFYMRHHGGNYIPTEFSLLAVWGEDNKNSEGQS
jgi:FkbM family methyltransferase